MRFTKRDLSRLLFKNVSPLKLLLHGICIGICLLPALATLIVGLIVFVTSPSDNITTPTQCTILSKLQCVTTTTNPSSISSVATTKIPSDIYAHEQKSSTVLLNLYSASSTTSSTPIECTYTVSFTIPSQSNQQVIHASTIPFPKASTHSNYTLTQQVPCFYDESNPKNVSFDKTNLVHFYTILGLGVIGVGGCLLFLVLVSMTIFFTNLCRFCVGHAQVRTQRKRKLRRNLLSILVPRSSNKDSSTMNTESDYEDDYQTDSSVERALDSSNTRGILQYGAMGNRDEGNGYYYSNANKKHARFNASGSGSSNGSGVSGSNSSFFVHVTSSTRVKKNKSNILIDERHFYQHSDEESEHDEKTDSSVEDIPVEIIGSLNKASSYPAHNF